MGLETGTYINSLVATNPVGTDAKSAGDDHIRLLKSTIKATFPNITGALTATHTQLNFVTGVTSAIQTQLDAKASAGANSSITSLTGLTTALSETQGGTGQATYTQGDILYASAANTLSKLPKGTTGQVLTQGATVPAWGDPSSSGGTVTSVSGTAPVSVATGTTTPVISMAAATASVNGYMSAAYASKLDGIAAGATVGVPKDAGVQGIGMMAHAKVGASDGPVASGGTTPGAAISINAVPLSGTWRNIGPGSIAANESGTFQRIA